MTTRQVYDGFANRDFIVSMNHKGFHTTVVPNGRTAADAARRATNGDVMTGEYVAPSTWRFWSYNYSAYAYVKEMNA